MLSNWPLLRAVQHAQQFNTFRARSHPVNDDEGSARDDQLERVLRSAFPTYPGMLDQLAYLVIDVVALLDGGS